MGRCTSTDDLIYDFACTHVCFAFSRTVEVGALRYMYRKVETFFFGAPLSSSVTRFGAEGSKRVVMIGAPSTNTKWRVIVLVD